MWPIRSWQDWKKALDTIRAQMGKPPDPDPELMEQTFLPPHLEKVVDRACLRLHLLYILTPGKFWRLEQFLRRTKQNDGRTQREYYSIHR